MKNSTLSEPDRVGAVSAARTRHSRLASNTVRAFLSISDLTSEEFEAVQQLALNLKAGPVKSKPVLAGRTAVLIFDKTSTRTRCSFEAAIFAAGGASFYLDWKASNFTTGDPLDEIKVLSRYYSLIVLRLSDASLMKQLAHKSEVPVLNAMSDAEHPCQALADVMTMREFFGSTLGLRVTYLGDPNNVFRSLALAARKAGVILTLSAPPSCWPQNAITDVHFEPNAIKAVSNADIIYTDTWTSMGYEHEEEERNAMFASYQVNDDLVSRTPSHSLFMHCLPAHVGKEVTENVLRSARSIVFDQAENRKYVQEALFSVLGLGAEE